jgi:small subunit ribosomal protein S16
MLVIRFLRTGKKAQPFFRIVVTDKKNPPKGGRFIENLGFVNPLTKEKQVKGERVKYWISVGAQPSDSVHNLLIEKKIIEGKKIAVHSIPEKKEEEVEEKAAPVAEAPATEEVKAEETPEEAPATEEVKEEAKEEAPVAEEKAEEPKEEKKEEATPEVKEEVVEEKAQEEVEKEKKEEE